MKEADTLRTDKDAAKQALIELGVPLDSEFAEFYLKYYSPDMVSTVSNEYIVELTSPSEQIATGTKFVHEVWGVPENYICFTSCQGEGGYLLDRLTGKVWDFDLANRNEFITGNIPAKWNGFFEFLIWYLSDIEK